MDLGKFCTNGTVVEFEKGLKSDSVSLLNRKEQNETNSH